MVCKMAKRGLLTTVAVIGGLALLFGTHAPSYVRTAFHRVRNTAQQSVISTQLSQQTSLVTLYQTLGGGWQTRAAGDATGAAAPAGDTPRVAGTVQPTASR